MSAWLEVCVTVSDELIEPVTKILQPYAEAGTVVQERMGDPDDLRPRAMLPFTNLKIYVAEAVASQTLRQAIQLQVERVGAQEVQFTLIGETDWATAWRDNYQPLRIGDRFLIQPSWLPVEPDPDVVHVIHMDPGMAFGTGQHETTQLCLMQLERMPLDGLNILDLGTGSGILAIAAVQLGAKHVFAIDIDDIAVTAARENAVNNHVADTVSFATGGLNNVPAGRYDLVVVNILAAIIIPMLVDHQLMEKVAPNGQILFSGIIQEQVAEFSKILEQSGGEIVETFGKGDWVAILARPK